MLLSGSLAVPICAGPPRTEFNVFDLLAYVMGLACIRVVDRVRSKMAPEMR